MNLQALRNQFSGRTFGELVLYHLREMKKDSLLPALAGNIESLPMSAKGKVEAWIDEISALGADESFWRMDAGDVFAAICNAARKRLAEADVIATDEEVLSMFQIVLINFVYGLTKHTRSKAFIQQSIGMGFLRRLLNR